MKKILSILSIALFSTIVCNSQSLPGIRLGAGLNCLWIVGNNANTAVYYPHDTTTMYRGGSYDGEQTGIILKASIPLDETSGLWGDESDSLKKATKNKFLNRKSNWGDTRLTVSLSWNYFSALESVPEGCYKYNLKNQQNVYQFNIGLERALKKFPFANSQIYVGVEATNTFLPQGTFEIKYINMCDESEPNRIVRYDTKKSAYRIGASGKLGVEGELMKDLTINVSYGYGVMNLNRDNNRGELFSPFKKYEMTPYIITEKKESYVINKIFSLLLQFRMG